MPAIARVGDANQVGGVILRGAGTVMVEGKPAGLHPSRISDHAPYGDPHPPHAAAYTTNGATTIFIEGSPVLLVGSGETCGHSTVQGALTVMGL
jgi:uncharacterized Zn-binding protein involved in type VI secretion